MRLFQKDELRILWPFYFVALFVTIFIIYAAFQIPYFMSIGLSMTQVGFLLSAVSLSIFLFEVPTGAIADIFGRKFSVITGIFTAGILFIAAFFFQTFYGLLVIFFLIGISTTLISGASDAWVVDLLRHKKKKNLIQDFYSKSVSFACTGLFVSGFVGAFLVRIYGLQIIWIFTGGAFILNAIIYSFAEEHFIKKNSTVSKQIKQTFKQINKSVRYAINHKIIFALLLASAILMFSDSFASTIAWYPFLKNLGFQDSWFGYLFSATALLGIFTPLFIKPLVKKIGSYKKYLVILLIVFFLLNISVVFVFVLYFALTIFMLITFFSHLYSPATNTFFQSFVPGKMRATITSFSSMWSSLAGIIAPPLAGIVVDSIGPQYTIAIGGILSIPAIVLYSRIKEK